MSIIEKSIVYTRLEEICPVKSIEDMSMSEIVSDCKTAFEIIGYTPKNLESVVEDTYLNKDIPLLFEFIYEVWLNDA